MPKFSDVFGVKSHGWINIELDVDQELYVDAMKFHRITDPDFDSGEADLLMQRYMGAIDYMIARPEMRLQMLSLIEPPHEMNETRFGLGRGPRPRGKATSALMLERVFKQLRRIRGLEIVNHPETLPMFTTRFGADRYSDLTTNIISRVLISYTEIKCRRFGIPMRRVRVNVFNPATLIWETLEVDLPVYNDLAILLVPEECVVEAYEYTAEHYVWRQVLAGRKFFLGAQGTEMTKTEIYKMDTADIGADKCKTYALQAAMEDPEQLLEYLERRQKLD